MSMWPTLLADVPPPDVVETRTPWLWLAIACLALAALLVVALVRRQRGAS